MYIGDSRSPSHIWKLIECIVSKHKGKFLPKEYLVQYIEEGEFRKEDCDVEDAPMDDGKAVMQVELKNSRMPKVKSRMEDRGKMKEINGEIAVDEV